MFESIVNTSALLDGLVVSNRYEIIRCLGEGAMGSVHLARDRFLSGNIVALKALKKEIADDENIKKRFLQEVKLMHRVNHHNVVRTYDVGVDHDLTYFTMEYVKGSSIEDLIRPDGIDIDTFINIAMQITAGLGDIHKADIIHRDLKPANVLISNKKIKIADFGVARSSRSEVTKHKEIIGSTPYIAPEIWLGKQLTKQADFYSLGNIFYELLIGHPPFEHELPATIMWMHLKKVPEDPKSIRTEIPQWLNSLVLRMLSKEAEDRPKSAKEIYKYLKDRSINKSKTLIRNTKIEQEGQLQSEIESVDKVTQSVILKSLSSTHQIIKQQEELKKDHLGVKKSVKEDNSGKDFVKTDNTFAPSRLKKKRSSMKFLFPLFLLSLGTLVFFNKEILSSKFPKSDIMNLSSLNFGSYNLSSLKLGSVNLDSIKSILNEKFKPVTEEKKHTFNKVSKLLQEIDQSREGKPLINYKFKNAWLSGESQQFKLKKIKLRDKDSSEELIRVTLEKVGLETKLRVLGNKNQTSHRIALQKKYRALNEEVKIFSSHVFSLEAKNRYWLNNLSSIKSNNFDHLTSQFVKDGWKGVTNLKEAKKIWQDYKKENKPELAKKVKGNAEEIALSNLKIYTMDLYKNLFLLEKAKLKLLT